MVIHIGIPGDLMEITRILGFYCKMPKVNNFPRQGDLMAMGKEIGIPLDTRFRAERLPRYHYGYGWKTRRPCEPDDNTCSYERLINRCSPFHSHDCFWPDLLIRFDPYPHTQQNTGNIGLHPQESGDSTNNTQSFICFETNDRNCTNTFCPCGKSFHILGCRNPRFRARSALRSGKCKKGTLGGMGWRFHMVPRPRGSIFLGIEWSNKRCNVGFHHPIFMSVRSWAHLKIAPTGSRIDRVPVTWIHRWGEHDVRGIHGMSGSDGRQGERLGGLLLQLWSWPLPWTTSDGPGGGSCNLQPNQAIPCP